MNILREELNNYCTIAVETASVMFYINIESINIQDEYTVYGDLDDNCFVLYNNAKIEKITDNVYSVEQEGENITVTII